MTKGCMKAAVEGIHSSPTQAVIFLSGGASQALGWLLSAPGASKTVLEAVVPYSRMSMIHLLGNVPIQFVSSVAAEEMALLAYNRALKLSKPGSPVVGVGFTGSLATAHQKFGDHRFHLSTRTSGRRWVASVTLSKGLRNREEEDTVSSHVLLKAIKDACKVSGNYVTGLTGSEIPEEVEELFDEDQELEQLISGKICFKVYPFSGEVDNISSERKIILSGSFNPLHEGHLKLLEVATTMIGDGYPCFELSAVNADKPPLTVSQIKDRVKQFKEVDDSSFSKYMSLINKKGSSLKFRKLTQRTALGKTVIISNQPFFYKKAELFSGSAFVIGADTAARLINPKYYGNDCDKMVEILGSCKNTGTVFLVGGRNVNGVYKVLEDFDIPVELRDMFISIPTERFRMDISSSEIRKSKGKM